MNQKCHYVWRVVALDDRRSRLAETPTVAASYFELALPKKRPNFSNGGLPPPTTHPHTEDGLYNFEYPHASSASKAVTLGDARDGCLSDPKEIIRKSHVDGGHASAQQLHRVSSDSGGENMHSANYVDAVLEQ